MMNSDNIKKIAESLFHSDMILYIPEKPVLVLGKVFNPYENDADAFKVLEALRKVVESNGGLIEIDGDCVCITDSDAIPTFASHDNGIDDLRGCICEAYIAILSEGDK